MRAKRDRRSRKAKADGLIKGSSTGARLDRPLPLGWIVLLIIFLAGGTGAFFLLRTKVPALPEIPTAQLDPTAANLIGKLIADVRAAPRSGAAWGKLGAILKSFDFREESRRCFAVAERFDSQEPRWPYLHGVLLASESPHESIALLRRAVALCGNEPDAPRMRLGKRLAEAGQWEEARFHFQELLRARPDHAPALLALANAAQARGNFAEAVVFANRCTADRHTARAAWTLLGVLHQRLGETNAAQAAIQKAGTVPPDAAMADPFELQFADERGDPRDLSDRAQRLLQSGRPAEAAPLVTQLVTDHPQFAEGWLLLGRWQLLSKEPAKAEQAIRHHLELDRDSLNGLFQLGMALLAQERFAEAAESFRQAIRLKPDFGPAHFNLGFALARSDRKKEAVACLREAIRHNPERFDSYVLLADLHWQLGQKAEAARWVRQAEALDPNDRRLRALREKLGTL